MKVLRVLGLVFGILLLLTGGGLLGAAALADRGQSAIRDQVSSQGFRGPVEATVVEADPPDYTVQFTDEDGNEHEATAVSTATAELEVDDTVQVYYSADDPSVAVITDLPTSALAGVASTLRVSGVVALVIGGALVTASVLAFVLGRRRPVPPAAPAPPVQPDGAYPAPYPPTAPQGADPYPPFPAPGSQPGPGQYAGPAQYAAPGHYAGSGPYPGQDPYGGSAPEQGWDRPPSPPPSDQR